MSRTLNDFNMQCVFPPPAKYRVSVLTVEKGVSSQKKTPQITVWFTDGENEFNDNLFVTEKAIPRLALFAKRVCLMDEKTALPDSDKECMVVIAKYIMENSIGKKCIVTIEENEESFVITQGPEVGQTRKGKKRRVAFRGFDRWIEQEPGQDLNEPLPQGQSDLPF